MVNQTKDPVCGMKVDSNKEKYKTDYQGKHYVFCSEQCLTKFKQNPKQYG